jgi:hypothetical protein
LPIDILGRDATVKTEKLSYRGIPTELARAPRVRAAGTFVGIFRNKLAAPGELVEFGTRHRGKKAKIHIGRVAVRAGGSFRVGNTDPINAKDCNFSIAPAMACLASRAGSPVEAGVLSAGSSDGIGSCFGVGIRGGRILASVCGQQHDTNKHVAE